MPEVVACLRKLRAEIVRADAIFKGRRCVVLADIRDKLIHGGVVNRLTLPEKRACDKRQRRQHCRAVHSRRKILGIVVRAHFKPLCERRSAGVVIEMLLLLLYKPLIGCVTEMLHRKSVMVTAADCQTRRKQRHCRDNPQIKVDCFGNQHRYAQRGKRYYRRKSAELSVQ